jgi:hypothetical protein
MAESTAEQMGIVMANILTTDFRSGNDPFDDNFIKKATNLLLKRYGAGTNPNFTLKFTEKEKRAFNKLNAWLLDYVLSVETNIDTHLLPLNDTIKTKILNSFKARIVR